MVLMIFLLSSSSTVLSQWWKPLTLLNPLFINSELLPRSIRRDEFQLPWGLQDDPSGCWTFCANDHGIPLSSFRETVFLLTKGWLAKRWVQALLWEMGWIQTEFFSSPDNTKSSYRQGGSSQSPQNFYIQGDFHEWARSWNPERSFASNL